MTHSLYYLIVGDKADPLTSKVNYRPKPIRRRHRPKHKGFGVVYRILHPDGIPVTDDMLKRFAIEQANCPKCRRSSDVIDNRKAIQ